MKVTILSETTKNPITKMGERAGRCWKADTTDPEKNYKRGINCLESMHGRVAEFPDIELEISDVSIRFGREWYTHIGGSPTRLQDSTRYNLEEDEPFTYVIPGSVVTCTNKEALKIFTETCQHIWDSIRKLKELGIPNEDAATLFPLADTCTIIDKRNFRNYMEMSHNRECNRAYWEFRDVFDEIKKVLSEYSPEWKYLTDNYFMPKCQFFGKCTEKKKCTGDHRIPSQIGTTINTDLKHAKRFKVQAGILVKVVNNQVKEITSVPIDESGVVFTDEDGNEVKIKAVENL